MISELLENIFMVMGGLGLFLFGMKLMSDGFKSIAGDRLRTILERTTANRFLGIITGTLVTIITNSSSATTIMVIGFISSGLMALAPGLSVIMGANIGTTVSAQIIAFKFDSVAPLFIFIGIIMCMFFKQKKIKNIGNVLLGFGMLFFGITIMGMPLASFAERPSFQSILTAFENPLLALMAGLVFTAVIQSSTASIGILIALYMGGVVLPFETAAFIVLGSNIGTCSDSLIASIPANRNGKRAALCNVIFKITGSIIFGSAIMLFPGILHWIQTTWSDGARQVAMFHTLFNVCLVIIFVPFIKQFVMLMEKIIPLTPEEISGNYDKKLLYLNPSIMQSPALAVKNAHLELCRMSEIALENFMMALESFYTKNINLSEKVLENEETINYLNQNIINYLVKLYNADLSNKDLDQISTMIRVITELERIGDYAENLAKHALHEDTSTIEFSMSANKEMKKLSELTVRIIKLALTIYKENDKTIITQINELEAEVDHLSMMMIENHIERLKKNICKPQSGPVFTDFIINMENCAEYANRIAHTIVKESLPTKKQ